MSPAPPTATEVAWRLASALEAARVPYAIGGALALGLWSDPRGTYDVDLNLFVDSAGLAAALDAMEVAGLSIDRAAAHAADQRGDVLVGRAFGLRIDLFTPSIPFAWEAMRTRRRVAGPDGEADYLSPEAIAVFKLLFFRPKDRLDVEKLVLVQGSALDRAFVRHWLVEMMGERDERVAFWDTLPAA